MFIEGLPQRMLQGEDHHRLWVHPDGRVQFFGLPSTDHEDIAGEVHNQIYDELKMLGSAYKKSCRLGASARVFTRPGSKEPDVYLRPVELRVPPAEPADAHRTPCPTLVVEVALGNESQSTLEKELLLWTGSTTSVQVALGVKAFIREDPSNTRLLFLMKHRNLTGVESVEFGPSVPNPPKIPLALSDLFWGTALAENPQHRFIYLNLENIRGVIMSNILRATKKQRKSKRVAAHRGRS